MAVIIVDFFCVVQKKLFFSIQYLWWKIKHAFGNSFVNSAD